jgi:hypothetical protein
MRLALAAALLLAVWGVTMADARPRASMCYRHAEAVADQAIRYTTQIMVMSDTCRNDTYERFAMRHRRELVGFQDLLKQHFRRTAGRRAQAKLDEFMTHLANEAALRASGEDVAAVCSVAVAFLAAADRLSGPGLREYAERQVEVHDQDYRFCRR